MRFLQLSYNFAMSCLWCQWEVYEVYEKSMRLTDKSVQKRPRRNIWTCHDVARWSRSPTDLSMRSMSLIDKSVPVAESRVSSGGFKPTHFQKRHPWDFSEIQRIFWGVGGGLREKKHELCQIVLNKQQHLHDAIIAFNFDHKFIVAIIVGFETRSSRVSRSYLLLIVA